MANELVKYDAARRALAEARRVDEVKNIRDKAKAMQIYAQQANDAVLLDHATEIRMRAEIRAGELLAEMKQRGERHKGDNTKNLRGSRAVTPVEPPKLSALGVSKMQSSRWQRLAKLEPDAREKRIAIAKQKAQAAVEPRSRSANGSTKRRFIRSKAISLADSCAMRVRNLVIEAMRLVKTADELSSLFAALRDEIADLERDAPRITQNGHIT